MTNLQRWMLYLCLFTIPYMGLLIAAGRSDKSNASAWLFQLQILPLVLLILFGLYCIGTVLYRTFTFRDCPEAAKELQDEIQEARRDLISKGFKFRD